MEPQTRIHSLVDRARRGDREAFNDLSSAHRDDLDRYVRLRLGSHLRQSIDPEDVLQESFVRACVRACV